jgi:hypothetical protein
VPRRDEAVRIIAREFARQIIVAEISPYEGARRIWEELAWETGADSSLMIFVGLASEWEDDALNQTEFEARIMEEAERLLNGIANDEATPKGDSKGDVAKCCRKLDKRGRLGCDFFRFPP